MRSLLLVVALLGGCPPGPKPTPLRDAAAPPVGSCDFSLDAGVPVPCASLFHDNAPCARCPVASGCYFDRAGIWCVPVCRQDAQCRVVPTEDAR